MNNSSFLSDFGSYECASVYFQFYRFRTLSWPFCFSFISVMVLNHSCATVGVANLTWILFALRTSKNSSPKSVILGDIFLLFFLDFAFRCIDARLRLLLPPLPVLLLFEEVGNDCIEKGTVSRCILEDSTLRFDIVRILRTLHVIYHDKFWRFDTHIIEVVFPRAQRKNVVHNVRIVTMNFISWPRFVKIHTEYPGELNGSFCLKNRNINYLRNPNIEDCSNFLVCINWCAWLESVLFLGAVCSLHIDVRFLHQSSSTIVVTKWFPPRSDIESTRCTEIFSFAFLRNWIFQTLMHSVSRSMV